MSKLIASFEKKGFNFVVTIEEGKIFVEVNGKVKALATISKHHDLGWFYKVYNKKFSKVLNVKQDYIGITHESAEIAKKMIDEIKKEEEKKRLEDIEKDFQSLEKNSPVTLILGTSYTFVSTENKSSEHKYFSDSKSIIREMLRSEDIENIIGRKADEVDLGDYEISFTYKLTFEEYKKIATVAENKKKEKEQAKKKKEEKRKAEIQALFDEAKRTGKRVEINRWTEPCNSPSEDCDLDIVIEYALPNGETEIVRNHTW